VGIAHLLFLRPEAGHISSDGPAMPVSSVAIGFFCGIGFLCGTGFQPVRINLASHGLPVRAA